MKLNPGHILAVDDDSDFQEPLKIYLASIGFSLEFHSNPFDPLKRLEKSADPAREGIAICVELIEELSTIPGVAGVHIMAPGNDAAIPEVIAQVGARVQIGA